MFIWLQIKITNCVIGLGLPILTSENTGYPVKYEFQQNNELNFSINISLANHGAYLYFKSISYLPKIQI